MGVAAAVTTLEGTSGRLDEVSEALKAYKQVIESRDGSVRFWVSIYAGNDAKRIVVMAEYESVSAAGASLDQMKNTEIGTHAFQELESSGAAQVVSRSLMTEWTP